MIKIMFLVSGGDGNLKFIYYFLKKIMKNKIKIDSVFGDRKCEAIKFAAKKDIIFKVAKYDRSENNIKLRKFVENREPDIIITTFHKIIDKYLVNKYKMINLHYSLLPAFSGLIGMKTVDKAIEKKCRYIGTTAHKVVEEVDSGEIIGQSILSIDYRKKINKTKIYNNIFRSGCLNLANCILIETNNYNNNDIFYDENFNINPKLVFNSKKITSDFWRLISKGE